MHHFMHFNTIIKMSVFTKFIYKHQIKSLDKIRVEHLVDNFDGGYHFLD